MINPQEAINHLTQLKQALTFAHEFISAHPTPDATDRTEDLYCRYQQITKHLDIQQLFKELYLFAGTILDLREAEKSLLRERAIQDAISSVTSSSPIPAPIGSMPNRLTALELRVAALESLNPVKVVAS